MNRDTCIECGINIRESESRYRCAGCRIHVKIWNNGFDKASKKSDMVIVKEGKVIKGRTMRCIPGRRYRSGNSPYAEKWEKAKNAKRGRIEGKNASDGWMGDMESCTVNKLFISEEVKKNYKRAKPKGE